MLFKIIKTVQLTKGENTLRITGRQLSYGLLASDYNIKLLVEHSNSSFECLVKELNDSHLDCTYEVTAGAFQGDSSEILVTIQVRLQSV